MGDKKKQGPQTNVTIRMGTELRRRLDAAAEAFGRKHGIAVTRSDMARSLLEQALAK
jgi:hypothetical protein